MSRNRIVPQQLILGRQINELLSSNPRLAAKKAVEAGLTPVRIYLSDSDRDALSKSTASWIHVGVEKVRIRIYTFEPPSPRTSTYDQTVILSPGFGNTAASMLKFVQPLLSSSYRVLLVDHHAHGDSEGKVFDLRICIRTIAQLAQQFSPLAGIIGFSMGSSAAVRVLAKHPEISCPKMVCIGPPLQVRKLAQVVVKNLKCPPNLLDLMYEYAASRKEEFYLSEDMKDDIAGSEIITNTKVLVIHDEGDPIASGDEAKWVAGRFENSRLEETKGLGHFGALRSEFVVKMAVNFVVGNDGRELPAKESKI